MATKELIQGYVDIAKVITDGDLSTVADLFCPHCQQKSLFFSFTVIEAPRHGLFIVCKNCKLWMHFSLASRPANFREDLVLEHFQKLEDEAHAAAIQKRYTGLDNKQSKDKSMKKELPYPLFVILFVILLIGFAIAVFFITEILRLPLWALSFPFIFFGIYIFGELFQFGPEKLKRGTFQERLSVISSRDRRIFWIITFGVSSVSLLEGYFFSWVGFLIGVLLSCTTYLLWSAMVWFISPTLRDALSTRIK